MNTPNDKENKAVIYARSAIAGNGNGPGTGAQIEACQEFAEKNGLNIAGIFSDEGVSGLQLDRPQLTALRDLVARDASIRAVIVADLNRLSRSMAHLMQLYAELMKEGIVLRCVQRGHMGSIQPFDIESIQPGHQPPKANRRRKVTKEKDHTEVNA